MTSQQELWTLVSIVLEEKGDEAPAFVKNKIQGFTRDRNVEGAAVWRAVAARLQRVMAAQGAEPHPMPIARSA
ncbi:DUF6961 family protein [Sphingobium nicotianae]|uniref:Uncharacterized protein n=1 Tax=Sphingobium nicotianae TaxID=2782607 RepID=A0A9X1DC76_9SPHN|nr:hypothetical protein [Sphingobium nicotianae]MBT2187249.1 hypothetical protein [Sphingobium nicotianae]